MLNRLKTYRKTAGLTQEILAERWGVTVRTLGRWERGEGRPAEWMRREMAAVEDPLEWPTASLLRELVENRRWPAVIYDDRLTVLTTSVIHKQWIYENHKVDVVGADWHRYCAPDTLEMLASNGGMGYLVRNGLMCMRGLYFDTFGADGEIIPRQMFVDLTVVRIPDYGSVCVTITRAPRPGEALDPLQPYFMDA